MDEPLSNLDAQLRHEMRREIRALQQKLGITMVYVTHDQTEAMSMADQVVLLNAGRIEQDAAPAELYARPATVFAARFIGTPPMNVIDCPGRADLKLGVRPEHVRLVTDAGLPATVQAAEYLGADTVLTCAASEGTIAARLSGRHELAEGARVRLAWNDADSHLFDAATGQAPRRRPHRIRFDPRPPPRFPSKEIRVIRRKLIQAIAATTLAAALPAAQAQKPVELDFYYPVAVGGPVTKIIDQMAADFEKENPGIKVKPIYAGTYQESIVKALTAHKSGKPPHLAVLLSTDMFTLIDEDAIVPVDELAGADGKAWLGGFYEAFMMNSRTGGKTWGVPFQRSTIVLYWNKELFKEAGLDPENGPRNWDEMVAFAKKLTRTDASGNVTQWGVKIPSSGFPYWLFQGLTTPNGAILMNEAGNQTFYDKPEVVEALRYWVDLSAKHKVMPGGVIEWGTTPKDFFEKKAAMIWTTTGNLTNIRANAGFPFGVAMLPEKKRRGSPTGGGNFYVFKNTSPEEKAASMKFIRWATSPQRAAQWSIATGYVAVSPAAWETPEMKKYAQEVPQALVARDQLEFSVAELSTHENQRVTKALNDGLQAALTGAKQPEQAMKDAQREADRILRAYRR